MAASNYMGPCLLSHNVYAVALLSQVCEQLVHGACAFARSDDALAVHSLRNSPELIDTGTRVAALALAFGRDGGGARP